MLDEGRCSCGCRIFVNESVVITTASGTVRDIPSVFFMRCVRCNEHYLMATESGKKTLIPVSRAEEIERALFYSALKDWQNRDIPDANESFIVLDEADKKDFERLSIK